MSAADELAGDEAMRTAWAASEPASRHLDERTWTAFLEGTLDAETREATLDHVSACVRCAGVFKMARAAALTEVPRSAPARQRTAWRPQLAALAATFAVAAVTVVLLRPGSVRDAVLAPDNSRPPSIAPSASANRPVTPRLEKPAIVIGSEQLLATRGDRDQTQYLEALAAALEPYRRDEFGVAARRLAEVVRNRPDAFEPTFYLGVSLLLDGRPQEAVPVLERAQRMASPIRRDEATRLLEAARAAKTRR